MSAPVDSEELRSRKPLWGFGWVGWTLLPVAVALGVVLVTGYDLQYDVLWVIWKVFGIDAVYWFVRRPFAGHSLSLWAPEFGLISLMYVLVAMFVHPRRFGWWYVVVVAMALVAPAVLWAIPTSWISWMTLRPIGGPRAVADLCLNVLVAALLCAMVRRAVTCLCVVACFPAGWWYSWYVPQVQVIDNPNYIGPLFHCVLAVVLLAWAVRARLTVRPPWECRACRYDLRGSGAAACPECGEVRAAVAG